jgi:type II secretory pathway component GspD/PulD (secretin)
MSVDAEISKQTESDDDSASLPGTSTKTVNTKIRTKSGSSIVISGLLQVDTSETIQRVPILGHIPLIGLLFQKITRSEGTSEMVIYITPYLHANDRIEDDMRRNVETYYQRFVAVPGKDK